VVNSYFLKNYSAYFSGSGSPTGVYVLGYLDPEDEGTMIVESISNYELI
jgi:hypothetical protein